ncbi:hypothetical protein PPAR_a1376 [Pseudoalteromonas paragorgicola KMM 3548]|nr:hypothetical protein [Pseudoalteromonas distincta KMM 3548]
MIFLSNWSHNARLAKPYFNATLLNTEALHIFCYLSLTY